MEAGKLDRKIQFWSLGLVAGIGGTAKTETLALSTWCSVKTDNSLSRIIDAGSINLRGSVEFIIYKRASFIPTKAHKIIFNGKSYVISSITDFKDEKDYWRIIASNES